MKLSGAVLLFHQNTQDILFSLKSFMSGVKKYKSQFTPDINLSGVWSIIFL